MTTMTDRYVWGVLRAVPDRQRKELEPEIRALVADAIEARLASGTPEADAERAALVELGDPEQLAARYTDRTLYLIGPRLYLEWRRLLTILLPIVPPIVGAVVLGADLLGGSTIGQAIVSALGAAVMVAVQLAFWITLVFALIERTTGQIDTGMGPWTPDALPEVPTTERLGAGELVASLVTSLLVAGLILWQTAVPGLPSAFAMTVDGEPQPFIDPALWSFWLPWFLLVVVLEIVFTIALYIRGRWTYPFAFVNAVLGAAFAIPALYLLTNGMLLNPIVVDEIEAAGGSWLSVTVTITALTIAIITIWDAAEGFLKAYRNQQRVATAAA